jgi:hypothetical protein
MTLLDHRVTLGSPWSSRDLLGRGRRSCLCGKGGGSPTRAPIPGACHRPRGGLRLLRAGRERNVFIGFLAGAGVLSLRHGHPEPVTAATERMGLFSHGLDMPSLVKDDFTAAQLSMLPAFLSERVTKLPTSGAGSSRGG